MIHKLAPALAFTLLAATACSSSNDSDPATTTNDDGTPVTPGTSGGDVPGSIDDPITPPDNGTPVSGGSSSLSGNILKFGGISIDESLDSSEVSIDGGFITFASALSAADIATGVEGLGTGDFCSVDTSDFFIDADPFDFLDDFNVNFNFISAGDVITLSGSAGTYAELVEQTELGLTYYESTSELPYPAPSPLTIDIPGDEFPAFTGVQVPGLTPLTSTSSSPGDPLTESTTLSWNGSNDSNARVSFSASEGLLSIFLFDSIVSVDCVLIDDGSFTLPAATVAELNNELGSGWSLEIDDFSRTLFMVQQKGDSVLLITRENY